MEMDLGKDDKPSQRDHSSVGWTIQVRSIHGETGLAGEGYSGRAYR